MLDDMFSFIDPIIELNENNMAQLVIPTEVFFDFMEQSGIDRPISLPAGIKTEVPLDIAMSLLRPDELEKLQKYVASYLMKRNSGEV